MTEKYMIRVVAIVLVLLLIVLPLVSVAGTYLGYPPFVSMVSHCGLSCGENK